MDGQQPYDVRRQVEQAGREQVIAEFKEQLQKRLGSHLRKSGNTPEAVAERSRVELAVIQDMLRGEFPQEFPTLVRTMCAVDEVFAKEMRNLLT